MTVAISTLVVFFACVIGVPIWFALARLFGLYVVVEEGTARVYILFGKVKAIVTEPGLHCPLLLMGPAGFVVNIMGRSEVVDLRLDQAYLRSQLAELDEDDAALEPAASWQTLPTIAALDGDAARSEDGDARARFVLRPARPGRYALALRVHDAAPRSWHVVVDGRAPAQLRATAGARTLALGEFELADEGQTLAVELRAHDGGPLLVDALRATECVPPERR